MSKLFKFLLGLLLCWIVIFVVSCYVSKDGIETLERIKYSGIMAAFAIAGYWLELGNTQNSKKLDRGINRVIYIFEGEFGRKLAFRIQNNRVYNGLSNKYNYEIKGNKIYKALSSQWVFRIEENRIYKGFDRMPTYRIEKNKVYDGDFGHRVIYRISSSVSGGITNRKRQGDDSII